MVTVRAATLAFVSVALMVGCGTASPTASSTSPSASFSQADVLAVAHRIAPGPSPDAHPCSNSNIATCPVTTRLAQRIVQLAQPNGGPGPVNSWCRCQNPGNVTMTAEVTSTGGTAHVVFGNAINVDFILVEQDGKLLLDDTRCSGGGASTSIYTDPLARCG